MLSGLEEVLIRVLPVKVMSLSLNGENPKDAGGMPDQVIACILLLSNLWVYHLKQVLELSFAAAVINNLPVIPSEKYWCTCWR
jgi:hypothetical protein